MKLNLNRTSLKISAGTVAQFPKEIRPQIALSGRSNVGKSSLINTLVGQKSLARVSSTPGKTITINFYNLDETIYLVDLPGYGYAKRSGESKTVWSNLTDSYFTKNPVRDLLKLVIQLIDVRVGPTDDDIMMITDQGTIVRTPVADINIYSRSASGVIVMRLGEGQKLVTFTKVAREDEAAEQAEEIAETDTEAVEITEEVEVVETVENTDEN